MTAKLADTNVWLALSLSGHAHHGVARDWLGAIDEPSSIHFCRATQQSFLRLLTNRTVLGAYGIPPLTNRQAWTAYEALLADDRITFVDEPRGLDPIWQTYAVRDSASPKLWMDAYLAACAVVAQWQLVTIDRDFVKFAELDLHLLG